MPMEKAWNYIWEKLFCERMNLLYDRRVGTGPDAMISHLPSPELIQLQIPNPCGWGTGMEDSMLSAGSLLDALISCWKVTGERELLKSKMDQIFSGMMRCAEISDSPGFLARSISPVDEKSYYFNSSRDQYTHWIFSSIRFLNSGLCDDAQKAAIRRVLVGFAEKAERDVREENGWQLLRADGKPGVVTEMWGALQPHEYFRLPMIYVAAWYVSGDSHWYDCYLQYRDEALEKSSYRSEWEKKVFETLQMQYSLRLAWDLDPDEEFRTRCKQKMEEFAKLYVNYTPRLVRHLLESGAELDSVYTNWEKVPAIYIKTVGEKAYYIPNQIGNAGHYNEVVSSFFTIQNAGHALTVQALCPNHQVASAEWEALEELMNAINDEKHGSYAPMNLWCGYWAARESAL